MADRGVPLRPLIWGWHMALPLLGLWLLLAAPAIDLTWEHHAAHFWLVTGVAGMSVALAARLNADAARRDDARLELVSLAFLVVAGFFVLHALATPTVIVSGSNVGFAAASPVGLILASGLLVLAAGDLDRGRAAAVRRHGRRLRAAAVAVMLLWAFATVFELPPLSSPPGPGGLPAVLVPGAVLGAGLYGLAAVRFLRLYRRRPSVVLLAFITACVLLAEALAVVLLSRSWHLSWWEWHLLLLLAFGYLWYSARAQQRREGVGDLFAGVALDETLARIRREHGAALDALVAALETAGDEAGAEHAVARVGDRFGLTASQRDILRRAAEAVAVERGHVQRLDALVAVGRDAHVTTDERDLVRRALALVGPQVPELRLDVELSDGGPGDRPAETTASDHLVLPLTAGDRTLGRLRATWTGERPPDRDVALLRSLAAQLAGAVDGIRLYRRVEGLFGRYLSPRIAEALREDPSLAELGGEVIEATVMFGDLRGFTAFSEQALHPRVVVALLNRYLGRAVPIVLGEGGTVDKFVGDALMAVFNWPDAQPDHALRAARAALAIQAAVEEIATERPDRPRFRIGVNTGPVLVGNIGSGELRNFTVIGDAVNLAARLEALAEPGQVLVSGTTHALIRHAADVRGRRHVTVKGRRGPVEVVELRGLRDAPPDPGGDRPAAGLTG